MNSKVQGHSNDAVATSAPNLEIVCRTDRGMVRKKNEDAVYADAKLGLAILADGMGGYNAGDIASAMAIGGLTKRIPSILAQADPEHVRKQLAQAISAVNAEILEVSGHNPACAGMGCTLLVVCLHQASMTVAHLGDSRLYRLRAGRLAQITHDHSVAQQGLEAGLVKPEETLPAGARSLVTRALGVTPEVEAEIVEHELRAGDLLLLCSDGLNDLVGDGDIEQTLVNLCQNLPLAADQLIEMANERGGRDNVSVILMGVQGEAAPVAGAWQQFLARVD